MRHFKKITRIQEWWGHILPPILLFYYAGLFSDNEMNRQVFFNAIHLIFMAVITALSGYFINDLFDIKEDEKAGKNNIVARFPLWLKIVFLPALVFIFFLPVFLNRHTNQSEWMSYGILFSVHLLLFMLYSSPPVRLKKKPWLAPVMDALYSGTLFYVLGFVMSFNVNLHQHADLILSGKYYSITIIIILLWGFLRGIRNYLTHLSDDQKHDELSGLRTLATIYKGESVQLIANLLYPFELIGLVLIFILNLQLVLLPVFACCLFLILWFYHILRKKMQKNTWLNDLYEVWLPLILIGILVYHTPAFYPLLLLHFILFPYHIIKIYHLADAIYFYTIFKVIGPVRKK